MKRAARIAALALLSLGLLYLLVSKGGLTWSALTHSIGGLGWPVAASVLVLTGASLAFSTLKWLLVMSRLAPDRPSHPRFSDAMLTTTLGTLLGQVMPGHISVALARTLAGRLGIGRSPSFNLGTSAFEQLFGLLVLAVAAAIGGLGLLLRPGPLGWFLLILFSGSIGVFLSMRLPSLLVATATLLGRMPFRNRLFRHISNLGAAVQEAAKLTPSIGLLLAALSVLRYAGGLLRALIVLGALGMAKFAVPAIIAFPLVQTIGLLPITPGNLGVTEWTWSAALAAAGAAMSAAALFAFAARIVNFAAQSIVLSLLIVLRLFQSAQTAWRALAF